MSDSLVVNRQAEADQAGGASDSVQDHDAEAKSKAWSKRHDVDFRLTIPLFVKDYYIAFVAGTERRDAERRSVERKRHPIFTLGNLAFLTGIGFCIWLYTKAITNWLSIISMSG